MLRENALVKFLQRLIEQDAGVHDEGSRRMIIAVLTAALVTDTLFVIFKVNPEVMFIYGILLLGALLLALRGFLTPARLVIPLGGLIIFTYLMLIGKGIRDIALLGLPVVIIASGLLFGKLGTLIYGTLSILALLLINYAEVNAFLPLPPAIINTPMDYFAAGIPITLVSVLQWLVIDRLNENIKKVQRNEEAQRLANEALRASEARYRSLIEESPEGILILNAEGNIILANPFACRILGFEEPELIGRYGPDLVAPDDRLQKTTPIETLLTGETVRMERVLIRKEGTPMTVTSSLRLMPDGRYQYIFQDISKQKQAEAEREALIHELEDKNAELERFTYTVSHDLKSPLVTIRGFLGYLEEDLKKGNQEKVQDDMRRIANATERMNRLLKDLLELSRIGRLMNPSEVVPFANIVREALELTQGQIKQCRVSVHVQSELPHVNGDRVRLVEVVQNLVDNAVKFMGNQAEPAIEIGVRRDQKQTIFFVCDNGIGIAPEFHERVFGLFNRLDQSIEGTGIGLTLVKRIIEVHGGRIWIESQGNGSGSTFCFTLPEK